MEMLHPIFLKEIRRKIPREEEAVNVLVSFLGVDKASVCEKLKGEMPFTFQEAMAISRQLEISLDSLELDDLPAQPASFRFSGIESVHPAKTDFALLEEMISILKSLKDVPEAAGGEITNLLPQPLYVGYEYVLRFYLFKWKYQTNRSDRAVPYKDIVIDKKLRKLQEQNVKWAKVIHTEYILDNLIFHYLINNINYFCHIGLITCEEVELIKQDLYKILDQIEVWARTGRFEETGKRIDIYISNVHVDTSYVYLNAPGYQLTIAKAFLLNGIASAEKVTFDELRHWIQSIKRQSVLITGCNEKKRMKYLKEQRTIIESLCQSSI